MLLLKKLDVLLANDLSNPYIITNVCEHSQQKDFRTWICNLIERPHLFLTMDRNGEVVDSYDINGRYIIKEVTDYSILIQRCEDERNIRFDLQKYQ